MSAEDLKWAEVAASTDASSWIWRLKALQRERFAAIGNVKQAPRVPMDTLALRAESVSLHGFLEDADGASRWPIPVSIPPRPNG